MPGFGDDTIGALPLGVTIARVGVSRVYGHYTATRKGVSRNYTKFTIRRIGVCAVVGGTSTLGTIARVGVCSVGAGGSHLTGKKMLGKSAVLNKFTIARVGTYGVPIRGTTSRKGTFNVYNHFGGNRTGKLSIGSTNLANTYRGKRVGVCRVARDIAGWIAFVGDGVLPDLDAAPFVYSATLPFDVPLSSFFPVSGTKNVFVTVRYRDQYGLESQNQRTTQYILTPTGLLRLPVPTPTALSVLLKNVGKIIIQANYTTANVDQDPATYWAVWVQRNSPADTSTPADLWMPVKGIRISPEYYPLESGQYYVTVGLFRLVDRQWSSFVTTSTVIQMPPTAPIAVPGGFALDCDCSSETVENDFVACDDWQDGIAIDGAGTCIVFHDGFTIDRTSQDTDDLDGVVSISDDGLTAITIDGETPLRIC